MKETVMREKMERMKMRTRKLVIAYKIMNKKRMRMSKKLRR
jgi:hypothetical protein